MKKVMGGVAFICSVKTELKREESLLNGQWKSLKKNENDTKLRGDRWDDIPGIAVREQGHLEGSMQGGEVGRPHAHLPGTH